MKLSAKSYAQIYETVKAYYDADGEDGASIADNCLVDLKNNELTFELWDSLGSDELGHVESNPQLKRLYKSISDGWEQASKSLQ
jgi:hypothetical protein